MLSRALERLSLTLSRNTGALSAANELLLTQKLQTAKNVVVMVGAGISTSAGIPDFRSPGTGLYSQLQKYKLPYPEAIFSVDFFASEPEPFYQLCKEIWPSSYAPTKTHHFIKLMHEKNKCKRCFTQNIDSLETLAGLSPDVLVAAHGNFDTATCLVTRKSVPISDVECAVKGTITWDELHAKHQVVRVKPDIVFFGEALPTRFFDMSKRDMPSCDLLVIIGTSLQVQPFAGLVDVVPRTTPRFFINRDAVTGVFDFDKKNGRDFFIQGEADHVVDRLAKELGWHEELMSRYNAGVDKLKAKM